MSAAGRAPPPVPARGPFAAGAEVEVRVANDFHGRWYEATVVRFVPARRRGGGSHDAPDRCEVAYAHLPGGRGRRLPALSKLRPRPPPKESPPRFLLHDTVEAFHRGAWRAGLVVAAPASLSPMATVTVAFPDTREAILFRPSLVRPRRIYVDGDWVLPPRTAMDQACLHLGDMVEVTTGPRWIRAKVARVVDDLSYVVEYLDLDHEEVDGGAKRATEYLHLKFIRPAVERLPREISEFQLGPGASVQAYCDGAWSPAVVRRVVGEGEFEVSIHGQEARRLVTKMVMPQYNWNGKQWTTLTAKAIQQGQPDPIKKSRKELQQLDAILADGSEHASVSETGTAFSALCKMPESNHSPSSSSHLCQKNNLQEVSCMVIGLLQNESVPKSNGEILDKQEVLSEITVSDGLPDAPLCVASAADAHNVLPISELGKKMPSSQRQIRRKVICSKVLMEKKDISKNKGTHPIREHLGENGASEIMVSNNLLDAPLCVASAGDAHNILSISELGKKMPSCHRQIRRKVICSKVLMEKKDISKNKGGETHPIQ